MSMIERVAAAIKEQMIGTAHQAFYEKVARAAIAAMREPSEEMITACRSYHGHYAIEHWQAMIDAALEGK